MRSRRVNTIFVTSRVRCWSRRVQGRVVLSQSRLCYSAWVVSFGPSSANRWFYECEIRSLLSSTGSLLEFWRVKQPLYVRPRPSDLTLGRPDQVCMLNAHTYSCIVFAKKTATIVFRVSCTLLNSFLVGVSVTNRRKERWKRDMIRDKVRTVTATPIHIANSTA